jgi:hypothetical protein
LSTISAWEEETRTGGYREQEWERGNGFLKETHMLQMSEALICMMDHVRLLPTPCRPLEELHTIHKQAVKKSARCVDLY